MARGFKVAVVAAAVAFAHLCRSSIALSASCFTTTGCTRSRSSAPRPAHQHHQQLQEHHDDDHRADHAPPTTIIKGGGAVFDQSRRKFATQIMVGGILAWAPGVSLAKESSLETDKKNLVEGYNRLTFLLDNWDKETTVCGRSDNPYVTDAGCERTPLKVMDYLGYRNTNHPLFKADKMLQRLEVLVAAENEVEYLEAIEKWTESADEGNGMAYISSWGEANPGGGKDRVLLFIQRAKKNVVDARDSLATAIRILGLAN